MIHCFFIFWEIRANQLSLGSLTLPPFLQHSINVNDTSLLPITDPWWLVYIPTGGWLYDECRYIYRSSHGSGHGLYSYTFQVLLKGRNLRQTHPYPAVPISKRVSKGWACLRSVKSKSCRSVNSSLKRLETDLSAWKPWCKASINKGLKKGDFTYLNIYVMLYFLWYM